MQSAISLRNSTKLNSFKIKAPAISPDRERELLIFTSEHGLKFSDLSFLNLAFTHTSYANESREDVDNNERLEFLGDSVLGMVTAEYLFSNFSNLHEGDFSKIKASVVSEESLSEVAVTFHLDRWLLMGKGEAMQGGKMKKAVLADAMEAVIAAVYLDQGLETAREYVLSFMRQQVESYLTDKLDFKDYKTQLQEYLQKRRRALPKYQVVAQKGPDHDQVFSVVVTVMDKEYGPANGKNKKSAELCKTFKHPKDHLHRGQCTAATCILCKVICIGCRLSKGRTWKES